MTQGRLVLKTARKNSAMAVATTDVSLLKEGDYIKFVDDKTGEPFLRVAITQVHRYQDVAAMEAGVGTVASPHTMYINLDKTAAGQPSVSFVRANDTTTAPPAWLAAAARGVTVFQTDIVMVKGEPSELGTSIVTAVEARPVALPE